jgi:hypothetical protein
MGVIDLHSVTTGVCVPRLVNNQKEVYRFSFDGVFSAEATQEQVLFFGGGVASGWMQH